MARYCASHDGRCTPVSQKALRANSLRFPKISQNCSRITGPKRGLLRRPPVFGAQRDSARWRDTRFLKARSSSNGRLTKSRPCRRRRFCGAKRSSLNSLSRTLWRSRATLWMAKSTTTGRLRFDDPAEHGPLTTRSGRDVGVAVLSSRSSCVWQLGYPAAARDDGERAVKNAREIGHPTTLMFALNASVFYHICCRDYAAAIPQVDELIALADERGAPYWKATGTELRGGLFVLTGKASDAVLAITSGMTSLRSTGTTLHEPWRLGLIILAMANAELGQLTMLGVPLTTR